MGTDRREIPSPQGQPETAGVLTPGPDANGRKSRMDERIPGKIYLLFSAFGQLLIPVTNPNGGRAEFQPRQTAKAFYLLFPPCVVLSVVLIAAAIWFWGANGVRGQGDPVGGLTVVGIIWLAITHNLFPWFGLSIRDDAWERKNSAAAIALACALLSVAITFAAGNLGEGPSYWENIFSAALATAGLFALWIVLELGSHLSSSIAEERDVASGLRFGGLLLCWGLILGRAIAGNWHSCLSTIHDFFRDGSIAVPILLVALVIELLVRPSRIRPFPSRLLCGVIPALLYLAAAAAWLWHLGKWEGMPA